MELRRVWLLLALTGPACADRPVTGEDGGTGEATQAPASTGSTEPTSGPHATGGAATATSGDPGDGSTTGAGPTTGAGSTGTDPGCQPPPSLRIPIASPDVVLLLDTSGAMGHLWDHDGDDADDDGLADADEATPATPKRARWSSLAAAVDAFLHLYPASMRVGAGLVPSTAATQDYSEAACAMNGQIEVAVAADNAAAILAALPDADGTDLAGASPTRRGVEAARAALTAIPGDAVRRILLVTDGGANCIDGAADAEELLETYDDALLTTVGSAASLGITTHVIGVAITDVTSDMTQDGHPDGVNDREELNMLALAGGTARPGEEQFLNANHEPALIEAFAAVAREILPCAVALPPSPEWSAMQVVVGDATYPAPVGDCTLEDGFRWSDDTHTAIELCNQACEDLRVAGELELRYGCPTG